MYNGNLRITAPFHVGVATYPPGAEFGPRSLKDFEFVWMIDGDAEYSWGQKVFAAPAGSIVLCRPGELDHFQWDKNKRTRHGYFHFQIESIPAEWPLPEQWPFVRELPVDDVLRPMFRHLLTWHKDQAQSQTELTISGILSIFLTGNIAAGSVHRDSWPESVETVSAYIRRALEDDPARQISLPELAKAASVTPEHLCRLFRSFTGRSPVESVRLARLNYASALLLRSNYSISQISSLCGFANPYHFSRLFKQVYGKSPREYQFWISNGEL